MCTGPARTSNVGGGGMLSVDLWFTTFCREKRIGASLVRLSTRCVHATFVETKHDKFLSGNQHESVQ